MSQQQDYGEYVCANCKKTFKRTRPLEVATKEAVEKEPLETKFLEVCVDCYRKIEEHAADKAVRRRLFIKNIERLN